MAINPFVVNLLICPETGQSLQLQDESVLAVINAKITAAQLHNRAGEIITTPLDGVLMRSDKQVFYPVRADIPIMLIDQSIIASELL